jgi:hypothetical protein
LVSVNGTANTPKKTASATGTPSSGNQPRGE